MTSIGLLRSKAKPSAAPGEAPNVVFTSPIESSKDVVIEHRGAGTAVAERVALPPGLIMHGHAGAVIGQRMEYSPGAAASTAQFKNEPLGKRIIEGVEAEGTRTTLTIPAGQIGNELPLDTISERWYSDELKTVTMTTRKDPRTGESTYKLTNLRRGEPSRLLFELPSDYKVITEDIVGPNVIRMRVDKKQE